MDKHEDELIPEPLAMLYGIRHWIVYGVRIAVAVGALALAPLAAAGAGNDGPLRWSGSTSSSGTEALTLKGVEVRFIERGRFRVGTLLRNGSDEVVTVLNARTPEPANSLVHQVSTRLALYHECNPRIVCPFMPEGIDAEHLRPVELEPDDEVGIAMSYRLGSCADATSGSFKTADTLEVTYRDQGGEVRKQTFPIGRLKVLLARPAGVECVPRPYSHIGLVGSFTTSPGHLPVPGSDGDTCARTADGALHYKSRYFHDRSEIRWRVEITIPHFRGKGTYATSSRRERIGPVDVVVSGSFGEGPGWSVFHGHPGTVTVTQATGVLYGGRLWATLSGKRRFFNAYGAWRCTTKLS